LELGISLSASLLVLVIIDSVKLIRRKLKAGKK